MDITVFYTTPAIYYVKSTAYGSWGPEVQIETPSAAGLVAVLWQYANNPSYATYGIDYLFTSGQNIGNNYWDNLSAAPPILQNGMMVYLKKFFDSFFLGKARELQR